MSADNMAAIDEHSRDARALHRMPRLAYRSQLPATAQPVSPRLDETEISPLSGVASNETENGSQRRSKRVAVDLQSPQISSRSKQDKMPLQNKKKMRNFLDFLKLQEPSQVALREFARSQKHGSDSIPKRASSASSLGSSRRSSVGCDSSASTRRSGMSNSSRTSVIRPRKHPVGRNPSNAGLHIHTDSLRPLGYERPKAVYIEVLGGSNTTVDETIDPVTLARHELLETLGKDEIAFTSATNATLANPAMLPRPSQDGYPLRTTSLAHGEDALTTATTNDDIAPRRSFGQHSIDDLWIAATRDDELRLNAEGINTISSSSLSCTSGRLTRSRSLSSEPNTTVLSFDVPRTEETGRDSHLTTDVLAPLQSGSCTSRTENSITNSTPMSPASTLRLSADSSGTQNTDPALFEFRFALPEGTLKTKVEEARPVTPDAIDETWDTFDDHSTLPPLPTSPDASTRYRVRAHQTQLPPALVLSRPFTPASAHSRNISQSSHGSAPSINFSRPRLHSNSPTHTELPSFREISDTSNPALLNSPCAINVPPPTPLSPAALPAPAPSPCSPNPITEQSLPALHRSSSDSSLRSTYSYRSMISTASDAPSELSIRWSQSPKERLGFGIFTPTSESAPWSPKNATGLRIKKLGAAPWEEEEEEVRSPKSPDFMGRSGAFSVAGNRNEGAGVRKSMGRRLSLFGRGSAPVLMGI